MVFIEYVSPSDYQLEYANYLAEKEFKDRLTIISLQRELAIRESSDGIIITETTEKVKEAIRQFIAKIITNIQIAWNKFKGILDDLTWRKIKEKYKDELNSGSNVTLEPGKYDYMPNLKSIEEFMNCTCGIIDTNFLKEEYKDDTEILHKGWYYFKDVKEYSKDALVEEISDKCWDEINGEEVIDKDNNNKGKSVTITGADIKNYTHFFENFKSYFDKIANDLKTINTASRTFNSVIDSLKVTSDVTMGTRQDNGVVGESSLLCNNIIHNLLLEYEVNNALVPVKNNNNNGENKEQLPDMTKQIRSYFKIFSTILSLKMRCINKVRNTLLKITIDYCRTLNKQNAEREKGNDNKVEKDEDGNIVVDGKAKEVKI